MSGSKTPSLPEPPTTPTPHSGVAGFWKWAIFGSISGGGYQLRAGIPDIGELFAPIDLALLSIGARQSVAMHWGTFVLTDEAMDELPRRLRLALERRGIREDAFRVMQHGEISSPQ